MTTLPHRYTAHLDEELAVNDLIAKIQAKRGHFSDGGACWVTFSNGLEKCYRGLDSDGCAELQQFARVKTRSISGRFCP